MDFQLCFQWYRLLTTLLTTGRHLGQSSQSFFLLNCTVNIPLQSQFKPVQGKPFPILATPGVGTCLGRSWQTMPAGSKGAGRCAGLFQRSQGSPRRAGQPGKEDEPPRLLPLSPADWLLCSQPSQVLPALGSSELDGHMLSLSDDWQRSSTSFSWLRPFLQLPAPSTKPSDASCPEGLKTMGSGGGDACSHSFGFASCHEDI